MTEFKETKGTDPDKDFLREEIERLLHKWNDSPEFHKSATEQEGGLSEKQENNKRRVKWISAVLEIAALAAESPALQGSPARKRIEERRLEIAKTYKAFQLQMAMEDAGDDPEKINIIERRMREDGITAAERRAFAGQPYLTTIETVHDGEQLLLLIAGALDLETESEP